MPRVTLSDGRWLDMRPIYVSDRLALSELVEQAEADGFTVAEFIRRKLAIIADGVREQGWDGPLAAMPDAEFRDFFEKWAKASEDDAVPPVSGTPSGMPSSDPDSAEQTASQPE